MDPSVHDALEHSQMIDLTTTGRRTGQPRRIEIVLHNIDGRLLISGMPHRRTRAWIHNLEADPRLIVHLKQGVHADVEGTARVVTDPDERRELLVGIAKAWNRTDVDRMVDESPLIELTIPGYVAAASAAAAGSS